MYGVTSGSAPQTRWSLFSSLTVRCGHDGHAGPGRLARGQDGHDARPEPQRPSGRGAHAGPGRLAHGQDGRDVDQASRVPSSNSCMTV